MLLQNIPARICKIQPETCSPSNKKERRPQAPPPSKTFLITNKENYVDRLRYYRTKLTFFTSTPASVRSRTR